MAAINERLIPGERAETPPIVLPAFPPGRRLTDNAVKLQRTETSLLKGNPPFRNSRSVLSSLSSEPFR
jgi:hypothetical protein